MLITDDDSNRWSKRERCTAYVKTGIRTLLCVFLVHVFASFRIIHNSNHIPRFIDLIITVYICLTIITDVCSFTLVTLRSYLIT